MNRKESPETKLVKTMITYLCKLGHHAWRNNTGQHRMHGRWVSFGVKGGGDIFACVQPHGRFLSVEAKVGRNKATDNQKDWMEKVRAGGGVAGVARSFAELDELIHEAEHETASIF